jgi:hypothetical protein
MDALECGRTTRLFSLPNDVLREIVPFLSTNELVKLYITGNSSIQTLLCAAKVVNKLEIHLSVYSALQWPSIISQFHFITSFRLEAPYLVIQNVDWCALPSTLKVLVLNFKNALRSLCSLPSESRLSILFPCLHTLSFGATCAMFNGYGQLELPKTLKSFTAKTPMFQLVHSSGDLTFPEFLLSENPVKPPSVQVILPKTLEKLKFPRMRSPAELRFIPSSITRLKVGSNVFQDFLSYDWKWIFAQPLALTHFEAIDVYTLPVSSFASLPSTLESFIIQYNIFITLEMLEAFPRQLKTLKMIECGFEEDLALQDVLPFMPPNITIFYSDYNSYICEPTLIHQLPRCLRQWSGLKIVMLDVNDVMALPPFLERLDMDELNDASLVPHFPQSISSLIIEGSAEKEALEKIFERSNIVDLYVRGTPIDIEKMPNSITSLNTDYWPETTPNLEAMMLKYLTIINSDIWTVNHVTSLPITLTELMLNTKFIEVDHFSILPRTLKWIWIEHVRSRNGDSRIEENALELLPPSLESLYLAFNEPYSIAMTPESAKKWPRKLVSLTIPAWRNRPIIDALGWKEALPITLTSFTSKKYPMDLMIHFDLERRHLEDFSLPLI